MKIQLLENSVNIMVTVRALVPYLETNINLRVGFKYKMAHFQYKVLQWPVLPSRNYHPQIQDGLRL